MTVLMEALESAFAHQFGPPAPAQHESQRIEKYGFAGAGFAGQNVQAGLEADVQPVNDKHIPDVEGAQHVAGPIRATRP